MAGISSQLVFGVFLVLCALLYEFYCPLRPGASNVTEVAVKWTKEIRLPTKNFSRIAIGVNGNLDLIVSALDLLSALNISTSIPKDHLSINNLSNLREVVGHSMQHCAGIERVFTDQEQFLKTVDTAKQLEHTYHIGGNAALMAEKVKQIVPDAQVMLVAPVGPTLRELLDKDILTPSFSQSSQDEVHMILEYSKGSTWGTVTATCANRVIYSHDMSNSKLVALEQFHDNLATFKADLIILSGAHLLESHPMMFRESRLADVSVMLDSIPTHIPVHWELATVGDMHYFHQLADTLFTRIDSLGLNEQELLSAAISAGAPFDFTTIPRKPTVGFTSDLLLWLVDTYAGRSGSRLTRVHFHSLTFHIIATLAGGPWSNARSAVMAGARVAGAQACDKNNFTPQHFDLKLGTFELSSTDSELSKRTLVYQPQDNGAVTWKRGTVNFELSPVLVCKTPSKTVGLGDAISSIGLLYSQFQP